MKVGLTNTPPVVVKPSARKKTKPMAPNNRVVATSNLKLFHVGMSVSLVIQDPYLAFFQAYIDRMLIL